MAIIKMKIIIDTKQRISKRRKWEAISWTFPVLSCIYQYGKKTDSIPINVGVVLWFSASSNRNVVPNVRDVLQHILPVWRILFCYQCGLYTNFIGIVYFIWKRNIKTKTIVLKPCVVQITINPITMRLRSNGSKIPSQLITKHSFTNIYIYWYIEDIMILNLFFYL